MIPYEKEDIDHMMEYKGRLDALKESVDARVALFERILSAGKPPHLDYWRQSIGEANKKIDDAYKALRGK